MKEPTKNKFEQNLKKKYGMYHHPMLKSSKADKIKKIIEQNQREFESNGVYAKLNSSMDSQTLRSFKGTVRYKIRSLYGNSS